MAARKNVDWIVDARWVIPVEPARAVLEDHSVVVRRGRIEALRPRRAAHAEFQAARVLSLGQHALLPGLINLHTHAAMTLMRGLADDLPLMEWLNDHIWPAEARHVRPGFVFDGTRLACAEMLRGGITCFNDMYFFPESAEEAVRASGMRAALGLLVVEFPSAYADGPDGYLDNGLALWERHREDARLKFCLAPHAPYTVSDRSFERVRALSETHDLPVHMHLHETRDEIRESVERFGRRPLARMDALGLLNRRLIAVHMIHLEPEEAERVAARGGAIAHCPSSNLKLASGTEPPSFLLEHGVAVGLGTDGAASNNRLDLFEEMRLAALLGKATSGRPETLGAHRVLEMATLMGARALGWDSEIGSLLPGKAADLVAVDCSSLEMTPVYDPLSHLAYVASRREVSHVWVAGRLLLEEGRLLTLDATELVARANEWRDRLRS